MSCAHSPCSVKQGPQGTQLGVHLLAQSALVRGLPGDTELLGDAPLPQRGHHQLCPKALTKCLFEEIWPRVSLAQGGEGGRWAVLGTTRAGCFL